MFGNVFGTRGRTAQGTVTLGSGMGCGLEAAGAGCRVLRATRRCGVCSYVSREHRRTARTVGDLFTCHWRMG